MFVSPRPIPFNSAMQIAKVLTDNGLLQRGTETAFIFKISQKGISEWRLEKFYGTFWNCEDGWCITIDKGTSNPTRKNLVDRINRKLQLLFNQQYR